MTDSALTVAVLGTGTMGAPMARNLLRAGFVVQVWNRTPARAAVVGVDARRASTPAEAAAGLDPHVVLEAIADGPMASEYALAKGAAMLDAEFVPGFPLRHATKDAELALSAAHRHGIELPLTNALLPRFHEAIAADHGGDDVASAITSAATIASPPGNRLAVSAT